jgi:hypothetical protein
MLSVVMLNVVFSYCYAECRYAECRGAYCCHAECRYAKCRYAERRGAPLIPAMTEKKRDNMKDLLFVKVLGSFSQHFETCEWAR